MPACAMHGKRWCAKLHTALLTILAIHPHRIFRLHLSLEALGTFIHGMRFVGDALLVAQLPCRPHAIHAHAFPSQSDIDRRLLLKAVGAAVEAPMSWKQEWLSLGIGELDLQPTSRVV